MRMYDIIKKKRDGYALSKDEIDFFICGYTSGDIPDYQASALLMAIYFNGMDKNETVFLTSAMASSGDVVDLSSINGTTVDKHSTGGVGDKTTLIVAPIVAALGCKVAKMSGRGLGHTGGTIDKLESIDGFKVELSNEDFFNQVNEIG
ncbi:MAG: pyrimidine-nucleoside phosphorylase, partial [Oscillospiraceae bacterium]